jgi:hypothetical protein
LEPEAKFDVGEFLRLVLEAVEPETTMSEKQRFPGVRKRKSLLKGMGSILHLHAKPPVRGYSLEEAVQHDSEMFWRDFTRATESLTKEMPSEQRRDLAHSLIERGSGS